LKKHNKYTAVTRNNTVDDRRNRELCKN